MQREKFINGLNSGIKFTDAEQNEIVKRLLNIVELKRQVLYVWKRWLIWQKQQISKYLRGCGDEISLLEEMADVYICLEYIEKVFEIHPDQILKAIDVKLLREKGRLDD